MPLTPTPSRLRARSSAACLGAYSVPYENAVLVRRECLELEHILSAKMYCPRSGHSAFRTPHSAFWDIKGSALG